MKFTQIAYERVNMEQIEQQFDQLLQAFAQASSFEEQDRVMGQLISLRQEVESAREVAQIRHTINTEDTFYKDEQDYWDKVGPVYQGLVSRYYDAIVHSTFRADLEQKWGAQLFRIAETTLRTFSPEVVTDLQEENRLTSRYVALIASAKIQFEGEERTIPQLIPYQTSTDRATRKKQMKRSTLSSKSMRKSSIKSTMIWCRYARESRKGSVFPALSSLLTPV